MDRIPYPKVRNYLQKQRQNRIERFEEVRASATGEVDSSEFSLYKKTYLVKEQRNRVWNTYKTVSPTIAWRNRKSSLGLLYSRHTDEVKYATDTCNGVRAGQVLYVHLRLLRGIYRLATAFEITRVDDGIIELCYIEDGISKGKQTIEMVETTEGYTRIIHTSMIRSNSRFRDKVLYPYFHNKIINEFHRNMKKQVAAMQMDDPALLEG